MVFDYYKTFINFKIPIILCQNLANQVLKQGLRALSPLLQQAKYIALDTPENPKQPGKLKEAQGAN